MRRGRVPRGRELGVGEAASARSCYGCHVLWATRSWKFTDGEKGRRDEDDAPITVQRKHREHRAVLVTESVSNRSEG